MNYHYHRGEDILYVTLGDSDSALIQTEHPHIVRVEGIRGGEPIIKGTGISVRTIVERTRLNDNPEQIVDDYPYLTLAQVYDALSYYHEHPQEIEQYIAENAEFAKRGRQ